MGVVNLKPQASFNYATSAFYREAPRLTLELGGGKTIYFYFDLPLWLSACALLEAKLTLHKFPYTASAPCECSNAQNQSMVLALAEPFPVYGCIETPLSVHWARCVSFSNAAAQGCVQIDITQIIRDWCSNAMENNGILLTSEACAPKAFYASSECTLEQMRPTLRLIFKNMSSLCSLQVAPCSVSVSRQTPRTGI